MRNWKKVAHCAPQQNMFRYLGWNIKKDGTPINRGEAAFLAELRSSTVIRYELQTFDDGC